MEEVEKLPIKHILIRSLSWVYLLILIASVILGATLGIILGKTNKSGGVALKTAQESGETPKNPQQDSRTFRDFAIGVVQKKPVPKGNGEYSEGTHLLVRDAAQPVALTSSVVDLSEFEDKKVKVFGETQKAIKEGWLMDVGKVEVID